MKANGYMRTVFDACEPRPEVLKGELREDIFAARLSDVIRNKADPVYQDPATFFDNTYPTQGLKNLLGEALGRLTGVRPANNAVIRLETAFGGGKTHNLIGLYHAARGYAPGAAFADGALVPAAGAVRVVGVFEEVFARLVEAGHAVLCPTITSKHSGTFNSAWAAAQRFGDQVRVVDTLSLSLGQGFQVLAAAEAAAKGLSLDEVAGVVEGVQERTHVLILLDTIEYIRRGGRADSLMPVLGRITKLLKIKPILRLVDGQLSMHSLVRSYERGLVQLQQEVARLKPVERLGVLHVRNPEGADRTARALAEMLDFPLEEIVVAETGPALSTHGGPHVVGVAVCQRAG